MKNLICAIVMITSTMAFAAITPPVKTNIKVYGNCGQCKERIESALDVKGIKSAEWNVETKMLEVVYVPEKISIEQIHKIIAGVGHDTEREKATDAVYRKLPDCCLYRENPNTHHE